MKPSHRLPSPLRRRRVPAWSAWALSSLPVLAQPTNSPPPLDLPPLVITGTQTERLLADVPVRTEVISAAQIEAVQAVKFSEAIEYTPGLRVENNCQNCGTSEIRLLGLQQRYISVLYDSLPTFSALAGVYGIEQLPTAIVDRIEVVKGGASTLYGANAVAGVVNIIPRDPAQRQGMVDFSYNWMDGSASGDRPNTDAQGVGELVTRDGRLGALVYGLQSYVDGLDLNADDFTEIARRDFYAGGLRTVWLPAEGMRLTADYLRTYEFRRGGEDDEALEITDNQTFIAERLRHNRTAGLLSWRHAVHDAFSYRAAFAAANTDRSSYYGGIGALGYAPPGTPGHDPAVPARLSARFPQYAGLLADPSGVFYNPDWTPDLGYGQTDNLLTHSELLTHHQLGDRHTLTCGLQFRFENLEDDQASLGRTVDDEYTNFGVFAQDEWRLSPRWEVVYGARLDKHSEVGDPIVSPRGAVKFSARDNLDLRASVATGFRAPEVFDEDLHVANVGGDLRVITLAQGLKEESSLGFSFGPDWRISDAWSLEANLYWTRIRDIFFVDESTDDPDTPGIIEATRINSGDADVHGAELNLAYRSGPWTAELGYTEEVHRYADSQLLRGTPDDPVDNPLFVRDFDRAPARSGVFKLTWNRSPWRAFAGLRMIGPMEVAHVLNDELTGELLRNELNTTGYFFTLDLGLAREWKPSPNTLLSVNIGAKNLFNEFQDDLDRGPFRDADYVYGPRFPRTLYAGVKFEF